MRNQILEDSEKDANDPIVVAAQRIIGDVDLSGSTIKRALKVEDTLICGRLILSQGAILQAGASFKGTTILAAEGDARFGALVAHGLSVRGNINMAGLMTGAILMKDAEIERSVRLEDAVFGALDLHNAQAASLVISDARQSNRIALEVVDVLRSLPAQETARDWLGGHPHQFIRGVVRMSDLQLDGQLRGERFVSEGVTILNDARVREARFRLAEFGALDMRGINVTADIRLYGATLGMGLPENSGDQGCAPREVPFFNFDFVDMSDARIGRNLLLEAWPGQNGAGNRASTSMATLCVDRVQVAGRFTLSGMNAKMLSLRSASIGSELAFGSLGTHHFSATELDLSDSSTGTLRVDSATRFPKASRFNDLALRNVVMNSGANGLKIALADLSPRDRIAAFDAIKKGYAASNQTAAALDVAMLREHAITETRPIWAKPFRWLVWALSGHGLRPGRTVLSVLVASVMGAFVALYAPESMAFLQGRNSSQLAPSPGPQPKRWWLFFDALIFSFDRLMPVVSLNDAHKKIQFRAKPWTRIYFAVHAFFGLLLAATAVGVVGQSLGLGG